MTYQLEWRLEDEARVAMLDVLYDIDGRQDRSHPQHSTYTGLWEKYKKRADE